jgi:4-hydroxybenzoate polyprenyltransferase
MEIKRRIDGSIRLSRFKEYLAFVVVTTFLGAASSTESVLGIRLLGVLVANWLAVAFAFMINDVEDAEDDALTPCKLKRNPISNKDLSPKSGRLICAATAGLSLLLFAALGETTFILGTVTLLLSFLYSWKPIRLKNIAFLDLLSHGAMLSGLQFLTAYFVFKPASLTHWLFSFMFVFFVSIYGELYNEMRDLDGDLQAGLRHTAAVVGPGVTLWLMGFYMLIAISSALVMVFWVKLLPVWELWLILGLTVIIVVPEIIRVSRMKFSLSQMEPLQKPLEIAAATGLTGHFAWPVISHLFGPWVIQILPVVQHWIYSLLPVLPRIF